MLLRLFDIDGGGDKLIVVVTTAQKIESQASSK
jgi:hypothetical protein